MEKNKKLSFLQKTVIVLLWIGIWELVALLIDDPLFLPSPAETVEALCGLFTETGFTGSIIFSILSITVGFMAGVLFGCLLSLLSCTSPAVRKFIELPVKIVRSTPVASFTILALLWVNSKRLSILISALMSLPVIYTNIMSQIDSTDKKLLKMADVFGLKRSDRIRYIYIPSLLPGFLSGCQTATGLAWKSGIAAEVIGITKNSIGNNLYQAKIYLETPKVFAWTLLIIIISAFFEKLVVFLIGVLKSRLLFDRTMENELERSYEKHFSGEEFGKILSNAKSILLSGKSIAVMGESGSGKTTLINKLSAMKEFSSYSEIFQENRLCNSTTVLKNLSVVSEDERAIDKILSAFSISQLKQKRVRELSGGERRRVSIARALLKEADIYFFDEPFTGLDIETRAAVSDYIRNKLAGKTICLITHSKEEARLLGITEFVHIFFN